MSTKNSQLRDSFYKNGKSQIGKGQQENKQQFSYGQQQKRTSHKDLSPSSGININNNNSNNNNNNNNMSTQFFNNPYNSTKNRSNSRSNNISPLNRFVSPKVMGPQESRIGQKRAQSSCRPSINNPNNFDGSLFSVLDQFKMSPQLPLNLGKSQEFSQHQQQYQQQQQHNQQLQQQQQPLQQQKLQQQNQPQKRKIRMLRQSIGSRQATRNDELIIDEYEYLNTSNANFRNSNIMDQTPVSKKSQQPYKENSSFIVMNNPQQQQQQQIQLQQQQTMKQSYLINTNTPHQMISPNNIGDGYFKNNNNNNNTPMSIKTGGGNPLIIRNSINNISVQIGNCTDVTHSSFKLSNKHSKDHTRQNDLYDFNLDNIDSPGLQTEQVYRIDTNISDDRVNTQATTATGNNNRENVNRCTQQSSSKNSHNNPEQNNNNNISTNGNINQDEGQSRIYALQNYLKNTSTSKYQRNSRRSAAPQSNTSSNFQVKTADSKYSKNSSTSFQYNTNQITKISDENQNPENQQTIKKQLNCIQVCAPQFQNNTAIPRNQSPMMPQKVFSKFDQNIQMLGQTDPSNVKSNKNDNSSLLMNCCLDPTIQQSQQQQQSTAKNALNNSNQLKIQSSPTVPHTNFSSSNTPQPQFPSDINNQDVEQLHFQFVEFQQKCKEWLKKIEI